MKRTLVLIGLVLAPLPLAACVEDEGVGMYVGSDYPYDGYYDDYYGPIYDGYWGGDGYFYYRSRQADRGFIRGDQTHFRRSGGGMPAQNFHPMQGTMRPTQGMRMPHFNGARGGGGRTNDRRPG
jgi:hypothetical protein